MLNIPAFLPPSLDTPVKDRKQPEPLTAESEQEASPTFEDINAEHLFRQFSQLVRVTEMEEEPADQEDLERRLTYDPLPSYRLTFEPKSAQQQPTSTMKKHHPRKELPALNAAQLFYHHSQLPQQSEHNDYECHTPVTLVKKEHPELLMTPHKERPWEE